MTTTSASAASVVASKPACSRSPAIRSESWTFIWQPNVSIRYLRAISLPEASLVLCLPLRPWQSPLPTFAFRPFAFAPARPAAAGPLLKHLTRGPSEAIRDRFPAEHARHFVHASRLIQPRHRGPRASPLDALFDLKVRIGVRRDLGQVGDAEDLK